MDEKTIIIDGENAVLGRLASFTAKNLLQGRTVVIVNVEKVIIVGRREDILERYRGKRAKGGWGQHGPFFPTTPERIIKRTVRGMFKYKKERGAEALRRVKAYIGVPKEFQEATKIKSGKGKKGTSLAEISGFLRGGQ